MSHSVVRLGRVERKHTGREQNESKSRPQKINRWTTAFAFALVAAGLGCATVSIRKVPTPTQYLNWSDDMQRKADSMEGLRFYLPRPFVNVFESFPIRTDIYLANGVVSPDGEYVIVTSVTAESSLSQYVATDPRAVEIPTAKIFAGKNLKQHSKAEILGAATALNNLRKLSESVPTGTIGTPASPMPPPNPPAPTPPVTNTGRNTRSVTNDNGAFAYQPLRGNFDLVYLPDFEEQYVISSKSNLGNAMFSVNLGQGWSLQGFDSLEDNSELNQRIFKLIDDAMRLAHTAASTIVGGLPFDLSPTSTGIQALLQPHDATDTIKGEIPGTPVTLKIVVIHYAAKGLYPVIKPRELQERALSQTNTYGVLDLFKLFPTVEMASSYDPTAIARAQQAIDNQTGSFTVPRYPYQYLSFNTFRYMAIEAVKPTSDNNSPYKYKYDKTGTEGNTGDARTGNISGELKAVIEILQAAGEGTGTKPEPPGEPPSDSDVAIAIGEVQSDLKQHADFPGFVVRDIALQRNGSSINAVATLGAYDRFRDFEGDLRTQLQNRIRTKVALNGFTVGTISAPDGVVIASGTPTSQPATSQPATSSP